MLTRRLREGRPLPTSYRPQPGQRIRKPSLQVPRSIADPQGSSVLPPRAVNPGIGTSGKRIDVLTNLFKMNMPLAVKAFQYSVKVEAVPDPDQAGKVRIRRVGKEEAAAALTSVAAAGAWSDMYAFDGVTTLWSTRGDLQAEVTAGEAPSNLMKVKLMKVGSIDAKEAIKNYVTKGEAAGLDAAKSLLQMVMKAAPTANPASVATASSFLSYPGEAAVQYGGQFLKILSGFRSSLHVVKSGVFTSVDHKVGAVLEDGPLLGVLLKVTGQKQVSALEELKQRAKAARVDISDFQVKLSHNGAKVRLAGFSQLSARDFKFQVTEGETERQVSVEQYYKDRYKVELKHPDLPCVVSRTGAAFPIELCTVVKAQRRTQLKDAKQNANLIRDLGKRAVVRPEERLKRIMAAVGGMWAPFQGSAAQAFGVELARQTAVKVPARLIPGPRLEYSGLKTVETRSDGAWKPPSSVRVAGKWTSGAVLVLHRGGGDMKQGLGSLTKALGVQLSRMGCPVPKDIPTVWAADPVSIDDVEGLMQQAVDAARAKFRKAPEMILVVLPADGSGEDIRNEVKRVGHTELGVASQCCDAGKAGVARPEDERKLSQYCGNVALKINTKLGGTTAQIAGAPKDWAPFLKDKHVMVIGADVSRAIVEKGSTAAVTYAAIIGTQDRQAVRTSEPQLLAQIGTNDDLIYGMEDAAKGLIVDYGKANKGSLPEVIIVYRDGVSESFYDQVLTTEFMAIKQACNAIRPGYNPKITYVVVSRSHNIRFFPATNDKEHTHRSGNVMPGTVVDDRITDSFAFEYFLNSHAGIIGTNRVPKYTVLVDEYGFSADSIQTFTHWLCHTYPLCHRSISVPPVLKYADKAAEEARQVGGAEAKGLLTAAAAAAKASKPFQQQYTQIRPLAMSGGQSMSFV